jgi:aldose 1-epimerase
VPFSNRVRDGRFSVAGRAVRLPVDPGNPHFLHGHGWRASWTVEDVSADRLTLSYSHEADAWPWSYRSEQRFALTEAALSVELTLTNRSDLPMPCGLGLHPYFPRDAGTRLTAQVTGIWHTDADVLPTRLSRPAPEADPSRGLAVDASALDNVFTGWDGAAEIVWPERQARLRMEADAPLRALVVYSPPGRDFFCAEPVSNVTDAFNMPGDRRDSGLIVLGAGESARAAVRFLPRIGAIA